MLLKAKVVAPPVCLSQTSGGAIKASKLAHYSRGPPVCLSQTSGGAIKSSKLAHYSSGRACSAIFVGIFKEAIYGKQY
ncbi:hypothetical protein AUJ66_02855 [Candidatus Desantisbacteria bacterium CG1_02_38_46]|uniref:Uncharacterized protein n=2 Tax=unclassified Candidatus Desantisiibacteriota TaxID=3106372 RepID=A0A2H9PD64_9BACT|nr:MAG: hypothetical protein AUJ66_02855 [Candidatus Desantisbacteria bacterium CG1_02_38_46]PIZ17394.1 MAG: hypothetical protein COY51_00290 [Candidatus Desantisbacteria bacterium CG_4_10_14_0_8_um_filter_39_17]